MQIQTKGEVDLAEEVWGVCSFGCTHYFLSTYDDVVVDFF